MTTDGTSEVTPRRENSAAQLTDELADRDLGSVSRTAETSRRLKILWDPAEPSSRGRKARLTVSTVVDAAIQVAKRIGLEALSMRRLAAELEVSAMSLYTYVPGRAELVDLMIDRAHSELQLPDRDLPWRTGLGHYAREYYSMYVRHPWILETNLWRAPLAPHVLDAQEAGLRTLINTPLDARRIVEILELIDLAVQGLARGTIAETHDQEQTGIGVEQHWESLSSFWEDYFSVERYPTMTRIYLDGGFDQNPSDSDHAIERLLDAIELTIKHAGT